MALPAIAGAVPLAANELVSLAGAASPEKVRQVARDFESLLIGDLMKQMRQSLESGVMFGKDGSDAFGGLFDFFMGKQMADSGGIGLSRYVESRLHSSGSQDKDAPAKSAILSPLKGLP